MTRADRAMVEKNLDLILEFERYVSQHPGLGRRIPDDAIVVFQVKKGEAFNRWSRRLAREQSTGGRRPIVHITISKMGTVRSRIAALKIERAA